MVVQCGYNEAVKSLTMFNSIKIPPRSPGTDGGAARGRTEEPGNFAWEQNVAEVRRSGCRPVNETSGKIFGEVLVETPNSGFTFTTLHY